jgi:hypothetical protein
VKVRIFACVLMLCTVWALADELAALPAAGGCLQGGVPEGVAQVSGQLPSHKLNSHYQLGIYALSIG